MARAQEQALSGMQVESAVRQDVRKTSPEKLEKLRELANDMARVASREPNNEAFQKLAWFAEQAHRILDGDW